jgi:hypothetical protein
MAHQAGRRNIAVLAAFSFLKFRHADDIHRASLLFRHPEIASATDAADDESTEAGLGGVPSGL